MILWRFLIILSTLYASAVTSEGHDRASSILAGRDLGVLRLDPRLDDIVPQGAVVTRLVSGFVFAEGPVWDTAQQRLLFTDVRDNKIYQWKNGELSLFLDPVFIGEKPEGMWNISANGLTFDPAHRLVMAEHGNRQVTRLDAAKNRTSLTSRFNNRRLNSPNDVIFDSAGHLFFTDPPYGLSGSDASPLKELPFNGVFRLDQNNKLHLLAKNLTRPNGLALSPDESKLYVANSDQQNKVLMVYDLLEGRVQTSSVFFDANGLNSPGVPDGLKVDVQGNIFATGPGGVLVLSPQGDHLGTISTGEVTANVGWGGAPSQAPCESQTLYMTASTSLYSIEVSTRGCSP